MRLVGARQVGRLAQRPDRGDDDIGRELANGFRGRRALEVQRDRELADLCLEPAQQVLVGLVGEGGKTQATAELRALLEEGDVVAAQGRAARRLHAGGPPAHHQHLLG